MNIFNTKQAAEILGVNDSRVRQLILAGRLPAQKVGRDWVIFEKDLKKVAGRIHGRPRKGDR
jgi:excisionase family DNA binding protein